ncbi:hypothetical protein MCUN1_000286 [Malassezia cuniculi]|uniref:Uncharacterized protein n=1 Tax=Malassezia cuniculi TaxID=948313 RepID=A0AAF0EVM9_9BASI|nr:hypothetical protein MCUN1_000286 [Malassezia cuniculi]
MAVDPRHKGFAGGGGDGAEGGAAPLAATADILRCYEEAVQEPMVECVNLDALYTHAQDENSDRMDARILREDFCSTAVVAKTWLALHPENTSQGVDIDLEALQDTQRRVPGVRLLQSPAYAQSEHTVVLADGLAGVASDAEATHASADANANADAAVQQPAPAPVDAATARLNRRIAKREAKAKEPKQASASTAPRMTLLHSDVLDLPVPPVASGETALEPPDLVASLNYAMAYFHDRATLVRYLRGVVATLRPNTGVFITDMFGGPPTGEEYPPQDELWEKFAHEPGFLRSAEDANQLVLDSDLRKAGPRSDRDDLQVMRAPQDEQLGTRAEWPRGKLKLVRTGNEHGGFEYWREDGPVDYMTNRFRMSLSFRFKDGSWLRDVFSYDFRIWSLRELMDAMHEAGFAETKVLVLPRNDIDSNQGALSDSESSSDGSSDAGSNAGDDSDDEYGFSDLLLSTERAERQRRTFHTVQPGEKVFSTRSFATYMVARVRN